MALRGIAGNHAGSTTNVVDVSGIGIQLNDIVILAAQWAGTGITFTLPSGFATIPGLSNQTCAGTTTMMALAYKVATGSEPTTYTVTASASGLSAATVRVYSGRKTTSIFTAVSETANQTANAPIEYALTGVTAAASDDVVEVVANQPFQGSPPGFYPFPGYGSGSVYYQGTTGCPILASCDYQGTPAGLTGTDGGNYHCFGQTNLGYAAMQISIAALNPPTITAVPGAFARTGQAAALGSGIAAPAGAFIRTGQAASLFMGASGYELLAAPGQFFRIGANASEGFELDCDPGAFAHVGLDMNLFGSLFITGEPGSFSHGGNFASFLISRAGYVPGGTRYLEVYDNQNGSMLLLWGELIDPPADSYNIYVNGVLNQNATTRVAIVSGLTVATYSPGAVAAASGNSVRPQNMPPTGVATPPGTYVFEVAAVVGGLEVAFAQATASVGPSSMVLVTPMKRLWPFPNTGLD